MKLPFDGEVGRLWKIISDERESRRHPSSPSPDDLYDRRRRFGEHIPNPGSMNYAISNFRVTAVAARGGKMARKCEIATVGSHATGFNVLYACSTHICTYYYEICSLKQHVCTSNDPRGTINANSFSFLQYYSFLLIYTLGNSSRLICIFLESRAY